MDLVSFSVTNFRSITKAYKLPIRRSTVLIGPNNEGKSNILQALVTTLGMLSRIGKLRIERGRFRYRPQTEIYDWNRDFPISLQAKRPDGESAFSLELRLSDQEVTEFEAEVKSKLNGTLPIELTLGLKDPGFRVLKKGPGGTALSKKAEAIAHFISKRINLRYIPAVRTANLTHEIVGELLERELAAVENEAAYRDALKAVAKAQQPVLDKLSASIKDTLKDFLPNVKAVKVSIPEEERYRALRRACLIEVDDGTPTPLHRKGDGVQSLAALSLMRHASEGSGVGDNLILAIEEPESHLHPNAIHQVRSVLFDIAQKHQVIMTTHCPLFVDRTTIRSNVIVQANKATPAKDVKQIRQVLGVRASDNLQNAELVLVVEGEDDRRSIRALLSHHSSSLKTALSENSLGIESLTGGSNLSYKLSQIREAMCLTHTLVDDDDCGQKAVNKALQEGVLIIADVTKTTCLGRIEAEFEDLLDEAVYSGLLQARYGVSTLSPRFKGAKKWSDRVQAVFKDAGKPWDETIKARLKFEVSDLVANTPAGALNTHRKGPFDSLVITLESKLNAIKASKN